MIVEHREFFDDSIFKSFLDTFEYSIDSVVITSTFPEEYFLYVNEAFKRKTGYVESDLIGKSPRILQGPIVKQNEDYKDKAYHDSLTGLYNRLKFDDIMQRKYREFVQNQKPFSLIMIDIDSFKNVNDTLGHEKGDKVLKSLAELLRKTLRSNDLLARWGGEEFVILIDRELSVAEKLAEKVRQAVEKKLKIENHPITISLGISQIKENDTIDTLFARVDKALYISKNEGKNRVTSL